MSQAVLGSYHLIYRIIKYSEGNSPDHHVRRAQPVLFFRADIPYTDITRRKKGLSRKEITNRA